MRSNRWIGRYRRLFHLGLGLTLALSVGVGCQSAGRRRVAMSEPGLSGTIEGDSALTASPPPASKYAWVDRHPLFSKPREMYETTNSNKAVKTAAAAVVGVPMGLFGELRQIVVGNPNASLK